METQKSFILKETSLSNNCPECFSNSGLTLIFKQKIIDNLLYTSNSKETMCNMNCKNCNTEILPIRWTDDIERVIAYQKLSLILKPKTLKLKPLAWVIIALDLIILITIIVVITSITSS
ncbi:hypothetical protein [Winogradskyella sp. UBA3174]|uniref:hypothetical protein n=1 Tax=Winogradskyella sp. UBA3174 TaxID=1947785 RepID=UPI0025F222FD|nr:hypothetical protein [Winogradskyella sp. UBA3174]|tara:strand:+ start:29095 stop:29451 length:357 start_codon:yes stop_codon:yes gene_type:complete